MISRTALVQLGKLVAEGLALGQVGDSIHRVGDALERDDFRLGHTLSF
jgi:hypothetical protein